VTETAALWQARQRRIVAATTRQLADLWRGIDPARISETWATRLPHAVAILTEGQRAAATGAQPYVAASLAAQGVTPAPAGILAPEAFAGQTAMGNPLGNMLESPAIMAKNQIGQGQGIDAALNVGANTLQRLASTEVHDAGRLAVGTAIAGDTACAGYVRRFVGATCPACIVLAGKFYRTNAGFARHPRCDCIHVPAGSAAAAKVKAPRDVFDSFTRTQQDAAFGPANAQAIREGADISQVVNARRGTYEASFGTKKYLATREGTTRRGVFGGYTVNADGTFTKRPASDYLPRQPGDRYARTRQTRLTPEQIYRDASGRDDVIRMLRDNGYLLDQPTTPAPRPLPRPKIPRPVSPFHDPNLPTITPFDKPIPHRPPTTKPSSKAAIAAAKKALASSTAPPAKVLAKGEGAQTPAWTKTLKRTRKDRWTEPDPATGHRYASEWEFDRVLANQLSPANGGHPDNVYKTLPHGTKRILMLNSWNGNCANAVAAYEIRRRGFDVSASAIPTWYNGRGTPLPDILKRWIDPWGNEPKWTDLPNRTALDDAVRDWPEGARGFLSMDWKNGGGHIINLEKINGRIRYVEPQDPGIHIVPGAYWKRFYNGAKIVRTDNLTPRRTVLDECLTPN